MMNKKGSTMVEATIVIPIIILICGSMILFSVYEYNNLSKQVELHSQINKVVSAKQDKGITFDITKLTKINSVDLGGITSGILEKKIINRQYTFDFSKIVRAKQVVLQNVEK